MALRDEAAERVERERMEARRVQPVERQPDPVSAGYALDESAAQAAMDSVAPGQMVKVEFGGTGKSDGWYMLEDWKGAGHGIDLDEPPGATIRGVYTGDTKSAAVNRRHRYSRESWENTAAGPGPRR